MTRLALALVALATALLPDDDRDRYREQWRADLLGARELGLSPLGVAFGALRVAVSRKEEARKAMPRKRPLMLPIGVLAPALRLRESTNIGAVLAVMLLANLGGVILLVV